MPGTVFDIITYTGNNPLVTTAFNVVINSSLQVGKSAWQGDVSPGLLVIFHLTEIVKEICVLPL